MKEYVHGAACFEDDMCSCQPPQEIYGASVQWSVTELRPYGASLTLTWDFYGNMRKLVIPISPKMISEMNNAYCNSLDHFIWPEEDDNGKER